MNIFNNNMLCEEELEDLKNTTVFDIAEIEYLYERFQFLDRLDQGYLTYNELNNIPEFEMNPFNKLIINYIEKRLDYENISFAHFLDFLAIFSPKSDKFERINFLFSIFDLNGDGRLCKSVLFRIYSIMGGSNVQEVDKVLDIFDLDRKGYLDYDDFVNFYMSDESFESVLKIEFASNMKSTTKKTFWDVVLPSFLRRTK